MRVLGIDPGSRFLGYGLVESSRGRLQHVAHGVVRPDASAPLEVRLRQLFEELTQVATLLHPDVVAIEGVFSCKSPRSALVLGQARGVALLVAAQRGLTVNEYPPARVKRALGVSGAADKEGVARMVQALLGALEFTRHDAADALAVAICHLNRHRTAPVPSGAGNSEAFEARLRPAVRRF